MEGDEILQRLSCQMCSFSCITNQNLNRHLLLNHRNEGIFNVSCKLCPYKSSSYSGFRSHCSRQNGQILGTSAALENLPNEGLVVDDSDEAIHENIFDDDFPQPANIEFNNRNDAPQKNSITLSLGQFFLRLEAKHGLSKTTLNHIANELEVLLNEIGYVVRDEVCAALKENPNTDFSDELNNSIFNFSSLVKNMLNDHKRIKFFKENFNLLEVNPVYFGKKLKKVKGKLCQKNSYGYTVPFLENLRSLVKTPDVNFWVMNSHSSADSVMKDWCDGSFFKNHELSRSAICLQIVLHVDDIETVNPIGVHRKIHKLTIFSYELANVPPQFRSRLHTKQLLAIAKSKDVREFGMKPILVELIEGINELKKGICLLGDENVYHGMIIGTPADTPASNQLWGFKESVAFAKKKCRTCHAEEPTIFEFFMENDFVRRETDEHLDMCEILEEIEMASARRKWSTKYGVNNRSPLFLIDEISLELAVHDPMHVLLEGIVLVELKEMLLNFIVVEKFFDLAWLNNQIDLYDYTYLECNSKPTLIDPVALSKGGSISISASACLTLLDILPFILSTKIPHDNPKLLNFILLIKIVFLSTSPYALEQSARELAEAIKVHHESFLREYPDVTLKPKFHFLIHFPKQLLLFGPLRHQWCMRFEANFNVFKGRKWGSFKNIALSMSQFHLLRSCYFQNNILGLPNENFLYSCDEMKPPKKILVSSLDPEIQRLLHFYLLAENLDMDTDYIWILKELKVHGHLYRPGYTCLDVSAIIQPQPEFALVELILIVENRHIFVLKKTNSLYVDFLNSFRVTFNAGRQLVDKVKLENPWPLSLRYYESNYYITNKYSCYISSD